MPSVYPIFNIPQTNQTVEGKIAEVGVENPELTRWQAALKDKRCLVILQALYSANAFSHRFAISARSIGRLTRLHHQAVRRLIRGDKRCRAKMVGLVAWQTGRKGQKTLYWLTPEGRKVAELIAKGFPVSKATLNALAADRQRRKVAHLPKVAHKSGTPSENNNMPFGFNNVCSLTAANTSKLSSGSPIGQKPANGLAERLNRDYGVVLWVANDIVARYSPAEIEAAIALRERRNGAIYNGAGFIVYLLKNGFAGNYVRARLQARKQPTEPDFDGVVQALREALSPYGITVDDEGCAELRNGRLVLPPDPEKALDLLRRCGILRDGNGNGENCPSLAAEPTNELWVADDLASDQYPPDDDAIASLTDWASDSDRQKDPSDDGKNYPSPVAKRQSLLEALSPYAVDNEGFAELPDDSDDNDDEGEPLPKCELCKRSEGEPHPFPAELR